MPTPPRNPRPLPQNDPELPPFGILIGDDDGGRVQCHVCGIFFRGLASHVRQSHGMSADEYREQFGLNRTTPLIGAEQQARLRAANTEHLARIRPEISPVTRLSRAEIAASSARPRRLQMRIKHAADIRAHAAEHPRLRVPKSPAATTQDERLRRAAAKRAELLTDPEWRARWAATIRRANLDLTADQIAEIAAAKGTATYREIVARYHVGTRTIARIWRGELRPDDLDDTARG